MATSLLLADDSPTIAKILQMALQSEDYEIRSVLTADEALRELKSNPPFFFLVDLNLPAKNGYEFARLIRQEFNLRKVRVVLLASAFEPVDEAEYQACGADGLVKKPFDPSELRAKLREIRDTPPKFPGDAQVAGALSGFRVGNPERTSTNIMRPGPLDLSAAPGEESGAAAESNADAILADLLSGENQVPQSSEMLTLSASETEPAGSGVPAFDLDFSGDKSILANATDNVLDLSGSLATPAGGTAMIDVGSIGSEQFTDNEPTAVSPTQSKIQPTPAFTPAPPAESDTLSPNAQALAAFFEAEINSQETIAPPITKVVQEEPKEDSFDASLSSIEWGTGPGDASLNEWSSSPPKSKMTSAEKPPAFNPKVESFSKKELPQAPVRGPSPLPGSTAPATSPVSASKPASVLAAPSQGGLKGSPMFDTGGSTFRFSSDYIDRITKSFTGDPHEMAPDHSTLSAERLFPQESDDRPQPSPAKADPAITAKEGGGAWSAADVEKIEQIVREEVQMVVREVAEKIAWEVIPELAENLIRKELEKVLKEMGQ